MLNNGPGLTLQALAHALGGEISGGQVKAPGPGHSAMDRSLSVRLNGDAPDLFVVDSRAGDDPLVCREHVRSSLGLGPWQPKKGMATNQHHDRHQHLDRHHHQPTSQRSSRLIRPMNPRQTSLMSRFPSST